MLKHFALMVLAACVPFAASARPCTDLALVLAIDASGSITDAEFALQTAATGRALSDPEVVAAMRDLGGVAVAAVIWGGARFGTQRLDWALIDDAAGARRFAGRLARQDRAVSGDTDLGVGLSAATDMLEDPAICAARRVINVSGDGREVPLFRQGDRITLAVARSRAERLGVVINGLAILGDDPGLGGYYRTKVVAGPGAFVMEVRDPAEFGAAMKRKLLREIGQPAMLSSLESGLPLAVR